MPPSPTAVKLTGEEGTTIIEWNDGHRSPYPHQYLRNKCPCATCTDHGMKEADEDDSADLLKSTGVSQLPILGQGGPLKPTRAEMVGHYALQIFWSDGHSTGIYTFDYLREICPCSQCRG